MADATNVTVLDHITMLERTGLVDFDGIAADAANTSTASPTGPPPPSSPLVPQPVPVTPGPALTLTSRPSTVPDAESTDEVAGGVTPAP